MCFEATCCQGLANDFSALQQLYLAIKDGPEDIKGTWDTVSKLQAVVVVCKVSSHSIASKGTK